MLQESDYDELLKLIEYREDGHFYHKYDSPRRKAGQRAGYKNANGYIFVCLGPQKFNAHRVAFYSVYGYLPKCIDHVNGDKTDNRIDNLRACTHSENQYNKKIRKDNSSGYKNVIWVKALGKYQVRIRAKGKMHLSGYFYDAKTASYEAKRMRKKLHGDFANNG